MCYKKGCNLRNYFQKYSSKLFFEFERGHIIFIAYLFFSLWSMYTMLAKVSYQKVLFLIISTLSLALGIKQDVQPNIGLNWYILNTASL